MLRNEIQSKTGLTRKAIEYYEEKGIIKPQKSENGYKDYSEKDLELLMKVALFRKLGVSVSEIGACLDADGNTLASILRKKQYQLDMDKKRQAILGRLIKGEEQERINEEMNLIEAQESIYEKLERAFPGYFGQMLFAAYQPFLEEPLEKDGEEAYRKFVDYFDQLPAFELSKAEQEYIEKCSSSFDMESLKKINKAKIDAVYDVDRWLKDNEEEISQYEDFKESEAYRNSLMKGIKDKLERFMIDNHYYETAIPLIRKFSKRYDRYYRTLLEANEKYAGQNRV